MLPTQTLFNRAIKLWQRRPGGTVWDAEAGVVRSRPVEEIWAERLPDLPASEYAALAARIREIERRAETLARLRFEGEGGRRVVRRCFAEGVPRTRAGEGGGGGVARVPSRRYLADAILTARPLGEVVDFSHPTDSPVSRLFAAAVLAAALAVPAFAQTADTTSAPPVRPVSDAGLSFSTDRLLVPVEGITLGDLDDTFSARRSGGRTHRAIDIMADRGTPVLAVADGEIVRIHTNRLGGKVLYLRSHGGDYDFYYAHLDAYAPGLVVGQTVRQGDVLGTVGNTGNARRTPPHLHFQVLRRSGRGRGTPVNPYRLFQRSDLYGRGTRG